MTDFSVLVLSKSGTNSVPLLLLFRQSLFAALNEIHGLYAPEQRGAGLDTIECVGLSQPAI
jgi:hypothetical protein